MLTSQETNLLSINELDEKTHSELVRDVACSVFFGFYDYRKGYTERQFKKGDSLQGIYAFLENIRDSSDFMQNYQDDCSFDDIDNDLRDCEVFYWKNHPYLGLDFTNLINDFHYHLKHLGKRYNIILNNDFYGDLVMHILEEIDILCHQFMPEITIGSDVYQIEGFIDKYMYTIRMIYDVEFIPQLSEIYKNYKDDKYDVNISYTNRTITESYDGKSHVRLRDTLL